RKRNRRTGDEVLTGVSVGCTKPRLDLGWCTRRSDSNDCPIGVKAEKPVELFVCCSPPQRISCSKNSAPADAAVLCGASVGILRRLMDAGCRQRFNRFAQDA